MFLVVAAVFAFFVDELWRLSSASLCHSLVRSVLYSPVSCNLGKSDCALGPAGLDP